jgi:hypothetical protein
LLLFVIETHIAALYDGMGNIAALHIQYIAVAYNDIGIFDGFQ